MHQSLQGATFHVEHIVPRCLDGPTELANLGWACPSCNLHKSNRVEAEAPGSQETVPLFNPRTDNWHDHFCWEGFQLVGVTPIGRATVNAFLLNHTRRIRIRQAETLFGLFPPDDVEELA